ncbi:MAG TPA: DUF2795 domain-containing protein [Nitrososphaeraceae archaeon]|jgi:hypothetical protein|nr:DUF2795 domain-containing protein [Nitrososphaeraceae archaeon]
MEESKTSKRENPDQIPQDDDTQGKTGRVVSEQAGVQGQRKEVNVESYSKVAAIGQILKDMDFPADKNRIISFARQQQSSRADNKNIENREDILSALQNLREREYKNVSDVTTALGMVY